MVSPGCSTPSDGIGSTVPPRHHRTVDRVHEILEHVAREQDGLSLQVLATVMGVPKSSLQSLVYGMVATGLLVESSKRYFLGPALFVLTLSVTPFSADFLSPRDVERMSEKVGLSLSLAIQMGDSYVSIMHAGDHPTMEYVTLSHRRRPLLNTATGKTILANMDPVEMHHHLVVASRVDQVAVDEFLGELQAIRESGLAFNYNRSIPGVYAVATGVYEPNGRFAAALCAIGDADCEHRLDDIGRQLQEELVRREKGRPVAPLPALAPTGGAEVKVPT